MLVLDEATSALDTATEVAILQSLSQSMPDRTIVLIAHRLSSIKHVDKVIVMRHGDVVEEGGYKELLDSNGHFTRMVEMQALQNHVEQKSGKDFSTIDASTAGAATTERNAKESPGYHDSIKPDDLRDTSPGSPAEGEVNDDLEDLPLLDSELKDSYEDAGDTMQKVDAGKAPYRKVFGRIYEDTRALRILIYIGIATATFVGKPTLVVSCRDHGNAFQNVYADSGRAHLVYRSSHVRTSYRSSHSLRSLR